MASLEEDLDEIFSIFTRARFADYRGFVHCYTCPWYGYWKECDAGHFISRGNQALRWEKDNARAQCVECNRTFGGRPDVFEEELRWEIGDEAVDEIKRRSVHERYLDDFAKGELLIHYKNLVKSMRIV